MKKQKKGKKGTAQSSGKKGLWVAVIFGGIILALLFAGVDPFSKPQGKTKSFYVKGGETRPVLDPAQFTGMTRAAYAAAKRYPQILDQVYCYCECDQPPFNHVSLLSCFVETHGAG